MPRGAPKSLVWSFPLRREGLGRGDAVLVCRPLPSPPREGGGSQKVFDFETAGRVLLGGRCEVAQVIDLLAEDLDLLLQRFAVDADAVENLLAR